MALTIGIDARELLGATTGVGRYLGELLTRWVPAEAEHRFVLYSPEPLPDEVSAGTEQRIIPGGRGTKWEQLALGPAVNRDAPDLFFAPAYTAPLRLQVPFAVTIHDISFSAHPEWFRWREGVRRRWLTRRSAWLARRVLTVSQFSSREIETHYAIPRDKIEVVYQGFSHRDHPPTRRERLVLFAGSVFNRRNVPALIAAFAEASRDFPTARLVIAGDDRTWPPQDLAAVAASHGVAGRTELRSYVSDEELASLYARAAVFVMLSEYEGFGLTPLEALAAGTPVVVLGTPVAREIYGEAVSYVPPRDLSAVAAAIRARLAAPAAPDPRQQHRNEILGRYSWDSAARQTLAALESITR